jgi:hypothetical protein
LAPVPSIMSKCLSAIDPCHHDDDGTFGGDFREVQWIAYWKRLADTSRMPMQGVDWVMFVLALSQLIPRDKFFDAATTLLRLVVRNCMLRQPYVRFSARHE